MYFCKTELFVIELFICIKIDLALNNLRTLICHKTQTNKQTNKHYYIGLENERFKKYVITRFCFSNRGVVILFLLLSFNKLEFDNT